MEYSPVDDKPDPVNLPREIVVSVQGINIPVPTQLLIHSSDYWSARVTEHIQACRAATVSQFPSLLPLLSPSTLPPIILDECAHGIYFSAYDFTVYVGLLQAEEHLRVALSMGLPAPVPLYGPLFRSFVTAGMPTPSAQTLHNVSRMASFFGRTDLAARMPTPPPLPASQPQWSQQSQQVQHLDWMPNNYSTSSQPAMQRGHELQEEVARRERQLRHEQWEQLYHQYREQRDQAVFAELAAQRARNEQRWGVPVTRVGTRTSYSDVMAGIVPMAGLPLLPTTATTAPTTASMSFSQTDDPVTLPPMLSPLPLYFDNESSLPPPLHPPPTPRLRHASQLSQQTPRLPPILEPSPLSSPPPMDLDSPVASGWSLSSTAGFFPQFPVPPRVDASEIEVSPIGSSNSSGQSQFPPRFPARFQSGRAATRRHQPAYHRDITPRGSGSESPATAILTEGATEGGSETQQPPRQQRHRLPDEPGQG
ncbi:hypothetical protein SBRCBS47491_003202 [Sporothrix bragantina]|uniref:Uncharacterized protein n=1 Tax=Sporothrix bragantina TaxID=671064 RepID=A0ABP0BEG8_9PEZI